MSCVQAAFRPLPPYRRPLASPADAAHLRGEALLRGLRAIGRKIALWHMRYQQRRLLRELDAHLLKDIGVTPEQARREAAKPFWID